MLWPSSNLYVVELHQERGAKDYHPADFEGTVDQKRLKSRREREKINRSRLEQRYYNRYSKESSLVNTLKHAATICNHCQYDIL